MTFINSSEYVDQTIDIISQDIKRILRTGDISLADYSKSLITVVFEVYSKVLELGIEKMRDKTKTLAQKIEAEIRNEIMKEQIAREDK